MPLSEGYRYYLTRIDRYTRWPEAVPISDQEAATMTRAFYDTCIARFGTSLRVALTKVDNSSRVILSFVFILV